MSGAPVTTQQRGVAVHLMQSGMSLKDVARRLGLSEFAVRRVARVAGIIDAADPKDQDMAMSHEEIAQTMGISSELVRRLEQSALRKLAINQTLRSFWR